MLITRGESLKEITVTVNHWHTIWPETFGNKTVDDIILELQHLIKSGNIVLLQIFEGSSIVSACCLDTNTCEIFNMYTIPEYRGLGYATRLLAEINCIALTMNINDTFIRSPKKYVRYILSEFDCIEDGTDDEGEVIIKFYNKPLSPIFKTLQGNA